MRALTQSEVRFVAGGVDTVDDVEVVGQRPMSRDEIERIIGDVDSGGGVSGGGQVGGGGGGGAGVIGAVVGFILDRIGGVVDNAAEDARTDKQEREQNLSDDFNPNDVKQNTYDPTGDRGWVMKDGSIFWDTDRNGKPDLWMKRDATGNVWVNEGRGWENRYPAHTQQH